MGPKVPVPASYKFQEKERKKQKKYSRTKRIKCSVLDETRVSIFSKLTEEILKDPLVDTWQLCFRTKGPREKHAASIQ